MCGLALDYLAAYTSIGSSNNFQYAYEVRIMCQKTDTDTNSTAQPTPPNSPKTITYKQLILFLVLVVVIFALIYIFRNNFFQLFNYSVFIAALLTFFCITILNARSEWKCSNEKITTLEKEIKTTQGELTFSLKTSYQYLDQYYIRINSYAEKCFFIAAILFLFGIFSIGIGIMAMFMSSSNASPDYTASYGACAAGIGTVFVASLVFYMYHKTTSCICDCYNKLIVSQNIASAISICESLPEDAQVKAKQTLISELLKEANKYILAE